MTGTLYEPGDDPPSYRGTPETGGHYVWVCDAFYEVSDGGIEQRVDGRDIQVAFEPPMPHSFDSRGDALAAAEDHIRTQFARVGLRESTVAIERIYAEEPPRD